MFHSKYLIKSYESGDLEQFRRIENILLKELDEGHSINICRRMAFVKTRLPHIFIDYVYKHSPVVREKHETLWRERIRSKKL